jgi:bacterioferritin-associated ferredoxin
MPFDPTPVRRCVCHDVTFAELRAAGVCNLEQAADRFGAGTNCQTCVPYLEQMFETGETAFPILPAPTAIVSR